MINSTSILKRFSTEIIDKIARHFVRIFTQLVIKSQINLKKHNCINDDLEKLMRQIRLMKEIHQIDSEISGYYESIMKYASSKISDQCDRLSASTTDQELFDFLDKISKIK